MDRMGLATACSVVLVALGLGLEGWSAWCAAGRRRNGAGPSATPLVPLVLYVVGILISPAWLDRKAALFSLAFVFHVCCQIGLPVLLSRLTFLKLPGAPVSRARQD